MKKTNLRRGLTDDQTRAAAPLPAGSGMDEAVEEILFSIACDEPLDEPFAPRKSDEKHAQKPSHEEDAGA